MSEKPDFELVWRRIVSRSGERFYTKTGLRFTYTIINDRLIPNRTRVKISKNTLRKAYDYVPIGGPSEYGSSIRSPTYVWAVLHDARISQNQW